MCLTTGQVFENGCPHQIKIKTLLKPKAEEKDEPKNHFQKRKPKVMSDEELIAQATIDFNAHFENRGETKAFMGHLGSEPVVVVESSHVRAYYSLRLVLIKFFKLQGEEH